MDGFLAQIFRLFLAAIATGKLRFFLAHAFASNGLLNKQKNRKTLSAMKLNKQRFEQGGIQASIFPIGAIVTTNFF